MHFTFSIQSAVRLFIHRIQMTSEASVQRTSNTFSTIAKQYFLLTKPRVVGLIMFTAIAGMFLSVPHIPELSAILVATIGIGLSAAAGATVNHVLDRDADAMMKRTMNRPLPTGSVQTVPALVFAGLLATASMLILVIGSNVLTAVLTFASLIGYAVIYTVFLKHATPQNIVIGGAAGAMPPMLGWTAITGELNTDAFLLFLIIFCWTPPHFWALSLYRELDYSKAGIPMLPVTHGQKFTRLHILLYTILLSAVALMPYATGMFGSIYLVVAVVLNALFIGYAVRLFKNYSDTLSRKMFRFSIQYLACLFAVMLTDHYLNSLLF